MIRNSNTANNLALDANNLSDLRVAAKKNSPEALKATAKQFEALFVNMMMKSMRDATPQDGPMDSDQSKLFTSMLDQQMSEKIANRGVGLADVLVRQMTNNPNGRGGQKLAEQSFEPHMEPVVAPHGPTNVNAPVGSFKPQAPHVKAFQDAMSGHAEEASRATGIPAKFMLGQAALESGWGKHEPKAADGSTSHNLFGIKATSGWTGKVVEAPTTEYLHGVPQTVMQKFRAYGSYAEAFHDYAHMLSRNPRYGNVISGSHDATSFAQGLQKAGYATDPHYATKLSNIINRSLV
ncbi:MAG TPA: flagellar assembly peptidoglycan hydrolase FlgJ [Burkholderiaceae bacterium]|jgi:flagellar protein FlgJ